MSDDKKHEMAIGHTRCGDCHDESFDTGLIRRIYAGLGTITSTIKAVYHDRSFAKSTAGISEDTTFGIILDRTNFYAESGGQEYDTGSIVIDGEAEFEVTDVQVFNGYVLHIGQMKYGNLKVGDQVVSSYDEVRHPSVLLSYVIVISFLLAPPLAHS